MEVKGALQVLLVVKNPSANAGDLSDGSSIPELGRWPERGHGNTLQYSCLESPMVRGAQQTTVYYPWGRTESDMPEATRS